MALDIIGAAVNLGAALALGAAIGIERQWRQRMAGLRTNTLVWPSAPRASSCSRRSSPGR